VAFEHLLTERDNSVAIITVNRPHALNALSVAVLDELTAAFRDLGGAGALILRGAGNKSFAVGADIEEIHALDENTAIAYAARGHALCDLIESLNVPVIATISGYALGGGCELAMACHIRLAAENAKLGQPEINLGLIPGFGGTQRLPRLIGEGRALDLLLTGRIITAQEALAWGLVSAVYPHSELMTAARKLASSLASKPAAARSAILEAIRAARRQPFAEALLTEQSLFARCCGTADMKEGTAAFLEKRKPRFNGQ